MVQYPSCRKWPYYNVLDTAEEIGYNAFSSCQNLVNLYIPASVYSLNSSAISNCPNLTLCCYQYSAAYDYALRQGLNAWYMDNKALQGIRLYSLPEQSTQVQGRVDLQGLYVVGDYDGKELQLDGYTLNYDQTSSGVKTVTVDYQGQSVTFQMLYYLASQQNIIRFRCEEDYDGQLLLIALYDKQGAQLHTGSAILHQGEAQLGVSDYVYQNADTAKLFFLEADTLVPLTQAQTQEIGEA